MAGVFNKELVLLELLPKTAGTQAVWVFVCLAIEVALFRITITLANFLLKLVWVKSIWGLY